MQSVGPKPPGFARQNKEPAHGRALFHTFRSDRAGNLTAAQTTGACVGMLGGPVHDHLHALDVGLPRAVGTSVRMAHLDAESNTLIAKFTLCHLMLHLLAR